MTSASFAASATETTRSPAPSAFAFELEPAARPTRTSTPESRRFSAWAWPCEPYPITATLRFFSSSRFASLS